jgi:hypothetical protein
MTTIIQTTEKTFNKKVKAQVLNLMPTAKRFNKKYVSQIGYVFYIKDENNMTLAKVFNEFGKGMIIYIG